MAEADGDLSKRVREEQLRAKLMEAKKERLEAERRLEETESRGGGRPVAQQPAQPAESGPSVGAELQEWARGLSELQDLIGVDDGAAGDVLERELRELRAAVADGDQDAGRSSAGGSGSLVIAALEAGADPDAVQELAELDPKLAEIEIEKERLEARRDMVRDVIDGLGEARPESIGTAVGAIGEAIRGLRSFRRGVAHAGAPPREPAGDVDGERPAPREPRRAEEAAGDRRDRVDEDGEGFVPATRRRRDELEREAELEDADAGDEAAAAPGGDVGE